MIQSMTGFGKAVCELPNKKINIEIKSLNSKQLDIITRLPALYREKDLEIRNILSNRLHRGKIDFSLNIESTTEERAVKLNETVIENYYHQIKSITKKLNLDNSNDLLKTLISMPDTLKSEPEQLNDTEWNQIVKSIKAALDDIEKYRINEGSSMEKDVSIRIDNISSLMKEAEKYETIRIERIKERIKESLKEIKEHANIDENRFEQELIYYIEKLDISEEKVRLKNHLAYFKESTNIEGAAGKKLAFISQEIGREINTLGSKANDVNLQHIVIKMKDELEKIKEQILNIL
ncbi:YicC family protein [Marinilabiliaceae bacterium ANBcel2]|nr:YicC family protein [Marinilabiliaceae bacterium ANBcel2]